MKRHPILIYWWNKYCENEHCTKRNLQILYKPNQNTHSNRFYLFIEIEKNLKSHMNPENTLDSQDNPEQKEKEYWKDFYHILQRCIIELY